MKAKRFGVCVVLLTTLLLTLPVKYALACSCAVPPSKGKAIAGADAVFTGTVVDAKDPHGNGKIISSGRLITFTFEVDDVIKGDVSDEQEVETAADGVSCGYEFRDGRRYQVFADEEKNGDLSTNLCSSTHRVAPLSAEVDPTDTSTPSEVDGGGASPNTDDGGPIAGIVWIGTGAIFAIGIAMMFITRRRDVRGSAPPAR